MKKKIFAVLLSTAAVLAGPVACSGGGEDKAAASYSIGTEIGINKAAMDTSVNPGDDFYAYANGNWQKTTEIPADRSSTGAFYTAFLETEKRNRELIDAIVKGPVEKGTDQARIANFYKAYIDTPSIDKAGMKPVEPDLARFAAITDKAELSKILGEEVRADVDPLNATDFNTENLFGVFVTQGLATPGEVIPYLLQGGLGMPEREYYLSPDPKMASIRTAYQAYIATLLTAAGVADADAKAKRIFDLETKIARAHASREESEDFTKSADVWTKADFAKKAPGIDWPAFFSAAQLDGADKFGAYHAKAITGLSALVASQPLEAWKDWLAFHQINSHADVLPSAIDNAHFAFYGTILSGTPEQRSRDKRAIAAVNQYLGDAVGRVYAEKYFPASAKAEVSDMVDGIKAAFAKRVQAIDWMAPETKKEALKKVETIQVGVGYPETWRDYGSYQVSADAAYANEVAGEKAEYAHQLAKIGKPFDKGEWWMTPQTVNAVNLPVQNALNFPAAILQPPFFDPKADPAYNYGAIGAVIGHEISHSFDNNGAAFDSTGALRNWWTDADLKKFEEAGKALAEQYDQYKPFPDLAVNGKLTLGENIADVAGLQAAYDAYRASLKGKEAPVIDGFTGDQRFFIAYAQTWATKMRDEALRARIATDGHAPGMYRALTVRNLDAWYKAFDVKPTDKLYLPPEKRVRVWG
ncbi:M13 family metallopeptidase [Sphingopyxis indica]|uniref:Endothelin-converting enzyme Metallo peptidase. MEROPS family M13 n=1 Tax=Sphingopyxis indica TaxID=436663 RepID=A0A239E4F0_9SPHN|nr:M13 family metallopeptidase [Sphingopyxis indica]SNS39556.1 endothelin-converting enzyme Metallo peptidase. MEROPS family M13 [Sphingopyxis indica]